MSHLLFGIIFCVYSFSLVQDFDEDELIIANEDLQPKIQLADFIFTKLGVAQAQNKKLERKTYRINFGVNIHWRWGSF